MQTIDRNIITRINEGDNKAFEQLYTAYYLYLRAVATKYVFQRDLAKDLVNDVFMNVWNHRGSLTYPVGTYLTRSVQNRCLNHLRRQRTQEIPLSYVQEQLITIREQLISDDAHPLAYLENKEFEEKICQSIAQLPPKCRQIFEQYIYKNMSYEEIAQANQITTSTVRTQIQVGLSKLKDMLGHYYALFVMLFNLY